MLVAVLLLNSRGDGGLGGESGSLESHLEAISRSSSSTSFLLGLERRQFDIILQYFNSIYLFFSCIEKDGSLAPLVFISLGGRMSPQFLFFLLPDPSDGSGELSLVVLVVTVLEQEGELVPLSALLLSPPPQSPFSELTTTFCLFLPRLPRLTILNVVSPSAWKSLLGRELQADGHSSPTR